MRLPHPTLKERVAKLQETTGSRQEWAAGLPDLRMRVHSAHTVTMRQGVLHPSENLCVEVSTSTGRPLTAATSRAIRLATLSQFSGDDSEGPEEFLGGFVSWGIWLSYTHCS